MVRTYLSLPLSLPLGSNTPHFNLLPGATTSASERSGARLVQSWIFFSWIQLVVSNQFPTLPLCDVVDDPLHLLRPTPNIVEKRFSTETCTFLLLLLTFTHSQLFQYCSNGLCRFPNNPGCGSHVIAGCECLRLPAAKNTDESCPLSQERHNGRSYVCIS